jgi:hypothetical protein
MRPSILYIHTLLAVIWGHAPIHRGRWKRWADLMGCSPNQARVWFENGTIPADALERLVDNLNADIDASRSFFLFEGQNPGLLGDDPMMHFRKINKAFTSWIEEELKLVVTHDLKACTTFDTVVDLYDDFVIQHLHKTM